MSKKVKTRKEQSKQIDSNLSSLPPQINDVLDPEQKDKLKELAKNMEDQAAEVLGGDGLSTMLSEFFDSMKVITQSCDTNSETLILLQKQNKYINGKLDRIENSINEIMNEFEGLYEILRDLNSGESS
jgi:hypothetical protein